MYVCVQLMIEASDQALPLSKTSTIQVLVRVTRDVQVPVFQQERYVAVVDEAHAVNSSVLDILARDSSLQGELLYLITGLYPAPSFFQLTPLLDGSARVTLTADLRSDSLLLQQYVLRVQAYDSAFPDIHTTTDILIQVTRNANGPRFIPSDTYERVLSDTYGVGERFLAVLARDDDTQVQCSCSFLVRLTKISSLFAMT